MKVLGGILCSVGCQPLTEEVTEKTPPPRAVACRDEGGAGRPPLLPGGRRALLLGGAAAGVHGARPPGGVGVLAQAVQAWRAVRVHGAGGGRGVAGAAATGAQGQGASPRRLPALPARLPALLPRAPPQRHRVARGQALVRGARRVREDGAAADAGAARRRLPARLLARHPRHHPRALPRPAAPLHLPGARPRLPRGHRPELRHPRAALQQQGLAQGPHLQEPVAGRLVAEVRPAQRGAAGVAGAAPGAADPGGAAVPEGARFPALRPPALGQRHPAERRGAPHGPREHAPGPHVARAPHRVGAGARRPRRRRRRLLRARAVRDVRGLRAVRVAAVGGPAGRPGGLPGRAGDPRPHLPAGGRPLPRAAGAAAARLLPEHRPARDARRAATAGLPDAHDHLHAQPAQRDPEAPERTQDAALPFRVDLRRTVPTATGAQEQRGRRPLGGRGGGRRGRGRGGGRGRGRRRRRRGRRPRGGATVLARPGAPRPEPAPPHGEPAAAGDPLPAQAYQNTGCQRLRRPQMRLTPCKQTYKILSKLTD